MEKFIDTPVKHYSSGMYVRLAFAVAAHLEPEILIVDEVLAVGDARFQRKCLGRMDEIGKEGRTVLLVSHNMQVIQSMCPRAILLKDGKIEFDGGVFSAVAEYSRSYSEIVVERSWSDTGESPGNEAVRLRGVRVVPDIGWDGELLTVKMPFRMEFTYRLLNPGTFFYVGVYFRSINGEIIFRTASAPVEEAPQGDYRSTCHVPGDLLNNGKYTVDLYFVRDGSTVLYKAENSLVFEVHDTEREPGSFLGELPGMVRPKLQWEMESVR